MLVCATSEMLHSAVPYRFWGLWRQQQKYTQRVVMIGLAEFLQRWTRMRVER